MTKPASSIANSPAASISSSSSSSSATSTCSTKSSRSSKVANPIDRRKRIAANARERKRMYLLNKAYDELRSRLKDAQNKSKYDVLVQAKEYIQALATICEKFDEEHDNNKPEEQQTNNKISIKIELINSPPGVEDTSTPPLYGYNQHHHDQMIHSPYSTASTHSHSSSSMSLDTIQSPPLNLHSLHHQHNQLPGQNIQPCHQHLNYT